jgi:kumamolisin
LTHFPSRVAALTGAAIIAIALPANAARLTTAASARIIQPAIVRYDIKDLGLAPASTRVDIAVSLNYRNQTELTHLVELQSTKGSPLYRHFLTPAQFAAEFAPAATSYARIAQTLQAAGFRVTRTYANRTMIDAAGTVAAAAGLFKTQLHLVLQRSHGVRYANASAAAVPASLSGDVLTVAGLDNLVKMRTHALRAAAPNSVRPSDNSVAGAPIERTSGGQFAGIYPTGLAKAYKYPSQAGFTGAGQAIGIVMDSDVPDSDLNTFWKAAKINRTGKLRRIPVDGYPGINADGGETALDVEMSSGLAPAADVDLYLVADLSDPSVEDGYNLILNQHAVQVVSSSFGDCELDDIPLAIATENLALQGVAEGITFMAASGDFGGYCGNVAPDGSLYYEADTVFNPASDPHFLAVGGTALQIDPKTGARISETAWGPGGANYGGGGGVSSYFARPAYQNRVKGMAVVPNVVAVPPSVQPNVGFAGRNTPDISFDASLDDGSYVAIYDTVDGGWVGYGGTSVSSPECAALIAEINQEVRSTVGFVNPMLYGVFTGLGFAPQGVYGGLYYDVTNGTIGAGWSAAPGYDQATGIGSINNASL